MTIGEKILNMRKARGWSQEELAEQVGVSRQAVSRWEADSAKPDAERIIAICDLFGVSADYLLRDMAGGNDGKTMPGKRIMAAIPWFSWCMAGFGAVTLLVLNILASVNRRHVSAVINPESGVVVEHGYYTGLREYVYEKGLEWLVWLAVLTLVLGAGRILWLKYKTWTQKEKEK